MMTGEKMAHPDDKAHHCSSKTTAHDVHLTSSDNLCLCRGAPRVRGMYSDRSSGRDRDRGYSDIRGRERNERRSSPGECLEVSPALQMRKTCKPAQLCLMPVIEALATYPKG